MKLTAAERKTIKQAGLDPMRVWRLEHSDELLLNTHLAGQCGADVCVLHNMTDHHMRGLPQHWRSDRGIMERICKHGVGHPDPDQVPYWKATRPNDYKWELVHGCCGCCVC